MPKVGKRRISQNVYDAPQHCAFFDKLMFDEMQREAGGSLELNSFDLVKSRWEKCWKPRYPAVYENVAMIQ
jgi:hypothetical protein